MNKSHIEVTTMEEAVKIFHMFIEDAEIYINKCSDKGVLRELWIQSFQKNKETLKKMIEKRAAALGINVSY